MTMHTLTYFRILPLLFSMAVSACSSSDTTTVKQIKFEFTVADIVSPYPILDDVKIDPKSEFTEKRIGAVSLIILKNVKGEGFHDLAPGYVVALSSKRPRDRLKIMVGQTYEARVFENLVSEMYVSLPKDQPLKARPTEIEYLTDLKEK